MPRSHRPRKRYVPKRIEHDTVDLATASVATLTDAQRQALKTPALEAFHAMRRGQGSLAHWLNLADAMNVAEALMASNIAPDHSGTFAAAQAALADVAERVGAGGSYTLRAAEIVALDDATFVHCIQLDHCSQGELQTAIHRVKRRVHGALAGSVGKGTRVVVPGLLGRTA